jgi:8-oxo-dGTP diphosphatase
MRRPVDDTWYQRPKGVPVHVAAGGIVARADGERVYIALIGDMGNEGFHELPKGHVDDGESMEEAARREIEEESGIHDLTLVCELGVEERLNYARTAWKETHYFLYTTLQAEADPTDFRHFMVWAPLDDLPTINWPEQRSLIEENTARIAAAARSASRRD